MTRGELEKEASVYANAIERKASKEIVQIAYIDAAESREKKIAELEEENAALKKQCKVGKCKNHFVAVDIQTNAPVICYKAFNCNECTQYNEG